MGPTCKNNIISSGLPPASQKFSHAPSVETARLGLRTGPGAKEEAAAAGDEARLRPAAGEPRASSHGHVCHGLPPCRSAS
jgi:hypothetical protein